MTEPNETSLPEEEQFTSEDGTSPCARACTEASQVNDAPAISADEAPVPQDTEASLVSDDMALEGEKTASCDNPEEKNDVPRFDFAGLMGMFAGGNFPGMPSFLPDDEETNEQMVSDLTFRELRGYDTAIKRAHELGIGLSDDPAFQDFLQMLQKRHGMKAAPSPDTLVIRAEAREDARQFALATLGELQLPAIRMCIDENLQGVPVLCVMTQSDFPLKFDMVRHSFARPGVLLLEDVDLWGFPQIECEEGLGFILTAQLTRGAREALALVSAAAEDPNMRVIATMSSQRTTDSIVRDALQPCSFIDIDNPTPGERADIWLDIIERHPSLANIDRAAVVRLSNTLSRCDIYTAAREAVETTYRESVARREYAEVSETTFFECLALFHPLDSQEYRDLENAAVEDFRRMLDSLSPEDL